MEELFSEVQIHPEASISESAKIGENVRIGKGAVIGERVEVGNNVFIGPHAILTGRTTIGDGTKIYPFSTIGSDPQDLKFKGEIGEVHIGKNNLIREYVNISTGTEGGGLKTIIGDGNLFMVYTHVGHDSIIGNNCIFANSVQLAGHVTVGNGTVFGGCSAAHQFTRHGDLAMIAAGTKITMDVPPFCMVHGDRAKINGLNVVGLRRSSFKNISDIKAMYKFIYTDNLTLDDAILRIESDLESSDAKRIFLEFLKLSERGIVR